MATLLYLHFFIASTFFLRSSHSATYLSASKDLPTYQNLDQALGGNSYEVPDCKHGVNHIRQGLDGSLNETVFFFDIHLNLDDDRCLNVDRQRNEIKTNRAELQGYLGEKASHSWNFKLDAGFQPSFSFTHVHQLKAVDGYDKNPLITLTPRKASPEDLMQLLHVDSSDVITVLATAPLANFKGTWVHVSQNSSYSVDAGTYSIVITRLSDKAVLMNYSTSKLNMWRPDTSFIRPKWGIYRSLNNLAQLRDETVRFNRFCIAKVSTTRRILNAFSMLKIFRNGVLVIFLTAILAYTNLTPYWSVAACQSGCSTWATACRIAVSDCCDGLVCDDTDGMVWKQQCVTPKELKIIKKEKERRDKLKKNKTKKKSRGSYDYYYYDDYQK